MTTAGTQSTSNVFIDLATFSEPEGFIYGGGHAITWFVRGVQKSNWFSFIPISLRSQGTQDFGQMNSSAAINRSGDYVLNIWFRAQIPQIQLIAGAVNNDATVRWTRNLMHNLFQKVTFTFNELVVSEFDNYFLDNHYQFCLDASKRIGYRNMIGDIAAMTGTQTPGVPLGTGGFFQCPFPVWFSQDSGVALPIAALPFNDVKINYTFRRWQDLVIVYPGTVGGVAATANDVSVFQQPTVRPSLISPTTWAHYAVVHNDERVKMGDAPRDILIKQVQTPQVNPINSVTNTASMDLRLSHSIFAFYFMAENYSLRNLVGDGGGEWSNYTTVWGYSGADPISQADLIYESTVRVAMGADYYSLTAPYYWSHAIPDWTGYHEYSYSLHPCSYNVAGSTNYSKLANVSLRYTFSTAAQNAAAAAPVDQNGAAITWPNAAGQPVAFPQVFQQVFVAENWNIARVANGSLGHPTL